MITETLKLVTTQDGVKIAVWKIADSENDSPTIKSQNILLTHGTFSDKKVCLGIANYLAKIGHSCYIMEWRGHGDSAIVEDKFNFETVATYDFEATFRYLFDELQLDNLHGVTHSGGGICLTMFLIQNPQYISKLSSISVFACQAYGAASTAKSYARIRAAKSMTRLVGYIPAQRFKLGSVNESYYTMSQWYDWNLNKNFKSSLADKNLNYRQQMPKITIPIYAISAKGDTFIAPSSGCELFLNDFNNPANVFREFSLANGDLENYNHSRIKMSRNAAMEIWPTVAVWIERHTRKV